MLSAYLSLIRREWPMLTFGLLAVFAGNIGQSFFISWYGASIQQALDLSAGAWGSAYSLATLASGFMVLTWGGLIDRVSLSRFSGLAALGLGGAALMMSTVNALWQLVIALFLLRFFGQGLLPHAAMTAMGRHFQRDRGKAISLASNGVPLGEVMLPGLVVLSVAAFGWQGSWRAVAVVVLLVLLPGLLLILRRADRPIAKPPSAGKNSDGDRRALLRDLRFWRTLPLLLSPPFIVTGIFIQQAALLEAKAWTSAHFAGAFVVYGFTHWLGALIAGTWVDRFSAARTVSWLGLPFVLGLTMGAWVPGPWSSVLLLAPLGFGIGMATPIFNALWVEAYGSANLGSIRSLTSSLVIFSTALSPTLFGLLLDLGVEAVDLLLAMVVLALLTTLLARSAYQEAQ